MIKTDYLLEYILNEARQGNIKKGQRLPGCRELSKQLFINKITINKAYKKLEEMHIVYCIPRGGYYLIGIGDEKAVEPKLHDFNMVKPDPTLIPYKAFSHAMNQAVDEHKKVLFHYDSPLGLLSLRETVKKRFEDDGIYTTVSQLLITNGAQQGIYLIFKILFSDPLDGQLLLEEPTYSSALKIAKSLNINCIGIKRNAFGIDLKYLEELFVNHQIRAFYIIPRFHNPTGYSLQEKDKKRIVELCQRYGVFLIEDDYLADLCIDKRTLPLHYYDINYNTFYIRSFSKTFMPGIRLGAVVIPDQFMNAALEHKYLLDICTSSLNQAAFEIFIKSGMYDTHLKKVNACYRRKLFKIKSMISGINSAGTEIHIPKQGLFIWLKLPSNLSHEAISQKLRGYGILIGSPSQFYLNHVEQSLRLSICGILEEDLSVLLTVIEVINESICNEKLL